MTDILIRRLVPGDGAVAGAVFELMASVFSEPHQTLSLTYTERLLGRESFWAMGAFLGHTVVGGITAHALPMTRHEATELFIFDLAVHPAHQRRGVGRRLVDGLRVAGATAGIPTVFVPADNDDTHALDFYRAMGADEAQVTMFAWEKAP